MREGEACTRDAEEICLVRPSDVLGQLLWLVADDNVRTEGAELAIDKLTAREVQASKLKGLHIVWVNL